MLKKWWTLYFTPESIWQQLPDSIITIFRSDPNWNISVISRLELPIPLFPDSAEFKCGLLYDSLISTLQPHFPRDAKSNPYCYLSRKYFPHSKLYNYQSMKRICTLNHKNRFYGPLSREDVSLTTTILTYSITGLPHILIIYNFYVRKSTPFNSPLSWVAPGVSIGEQ